MIRTFGMGVGCARRNSTPYIAPPFTPQPVTFDGTNDFLLRSGQFAQPPQTTRQVTCLALYAPVTTFAGYRQWLYSSGFSGGSDNDFRFGMYAVTGGQMGIILESGDFAQLKVDIKTSTVGVAANKGYWNLFGVSVDMDIGTSATRSFCVSSNGNSVNRTTSPNYTENDIVTGSSSMQLSNAAKVMGYVDPYDPDWAFGLAAGDLAMLYVAPGYVDLSESGDLDLIVSMDNILQNIPAHISSGALPRPSVFLRDQAATYGNEGTAGSFVEYGSITDAANPIPFVE